MSHGLGFLRKRLRESHEFVSRSRPLRQGGIQTNAVPLLLSLSQTSHTNEWVTLRVRLLGWLPIAERGAPCVGNRSTPSACRRANHCPPAAVLSCGAGLATGSFDQAHEADHASPPGEGAALAPSKRLHREADAPGPASAVRAEFELDVAHGDEPVRRAPDGDPCDGAIVMCGRHRNS